MAGATNASAGTGGSAVSTDPSGAGRSQFLIQRPAPGSIAVAEAPAGANLKFNFASTDARLLVQDVDVVVAFPDGARIVLPGFAFNLLSAGGEVAFTDRTQSAQEVFANISDLRLVDNPDLRTMSSGDDKEGGAKETAPPAPPPAPAPTPASSPAKPSGVADFDKPPQEFSDNTSKIHAARSSIPSASGSPGLPDRGASVNNAVASNDAGGASKPPGDVELDITLLGVAKGQAIDLPAGGQDIRGAAAVAAAATDESFDVQQAVKQLVGTGRDDVIHALDPARMPSGTFERLIDVKMRFSDAGFIAETVTITELPDGFAVNNAEKVGDNWVLALSKADPDHLQIELRYVLPANGAAPGGAPDSFDLNIAISGKDSQGNPLVYTGAQPFTVREIMKESDVVTTAEDETKIYALNATPPGTRIFAGDGNDTVYAGPGHDTLDGGSGDNLLSYAQSAAGVTVDLSLGRGAGGYAEGDTLQNFSSVEGSVYADRLTGTAENNTFYGGGGADAFIGNDGEDTVDYSASTAGVTVDLATGTGSGGLATDNALVDIENVTGSTIGPNMLIGTTGANRLLGGAGNDTIDGAGGADVILAGGGEDTVAFYASERMIDAGTGADNLIMKGAATVDLAAADQTIGDDALVSGFENIDASALSQGVALAASTGGNRILGGAGADTIDGVGGLDIIDGGAGDDRIGYVGAEVSIDGGAGDNTLVMRAPALVELARADQTRDDTVAVRGFQNVDAAALGLSQPVTLIGSDSANRLSGGAGADSIDGGGGADIIDAGGGDDRIAYRGSEDWIDGGSGTNTLWLDRAVTVDLSAADQTSGDTALVQRFANIDADGLTDAVSLTGDAGANSLLGGAGADRLDGGGGADLIEANGGDDHVTQRAGALVIDGGGGADTLLLAADAGVSRVDFSLPPGIDQTISDTATVVNFENLEAASVGSALYVTGSTGANVLSTGSGADTIDGGGGFDVIALNAGDDTAYYRGTEKAISGGDGSNSLVLLAATNVDLSRADQTTGDSVEVSGFRNIDARALGAAQGVALAGTVLDNTFFGGSGDDTIDGGGGVDAIAALAGDDRVVARGAETGIDGGAGVDTLVLASSSSVSSVNFLFSSGMDQTAGDGAVVVNFEKLDARALAGDLTVIGGVGADSILTGSGADVVHGGGGGDVIQTGAGNDIVDWTGFEAYLDGGADIDTLAMRTGGMIGLGAADQSLGDVTIVVNFENIDASSLTSLQATSLRGTEVANLIRGGGGGDTIDGAAGLDTIEAGGGVDLVTCHGTESLVDGGAGVDTLVLAASAVVRAIDLSAAADQTTGDATVVLGFENLDASSYAAALAITGSGAANVISTGDGADTIDGGGGADVILAGGGADRVIYRGSETAIDGGSGVNVLQLMTATDINMGRSDLTVGDSVNVQGFQDLDASRLNATQGIAVVGLATANVIATGGGADTIDGAGGVDVISGGGGNDTIAFYGTEISIDGGAGENTLVLKVAATIDLSVADQTSDDALRVVAGFVDVDATTLSADVAILGSTNDNILSGGKGADTIDGRGGIDMISAGGGADTVVHRGSENTIDGGLGNDMLQLTSTSGVSAVDLSVASGLDQTGGDPTVVTAFENVDASMSSDRIELIGSVASNVLIGGAGADMIDGRGGLDVIRGGDGDDIVTARGGEATIDGGANQDMLILTAPGVVAVNFSVVAGVDQTLGDSSFISNFESLDTRTLGGALSVTGSSGANTILTGSGADTINGGAGADSIDAGGGDDRVVYHATELGVDGGSGNNTLTLNTAATINLTNADQTSGDSVTVTNFQNIEASALGTGNAIIGSASVNIITTGAGADTIDGGGGNDVIVTGAGADVVTVRGAESSIDGGADTDTLVLTAAGVTGVDFSVAADIDQTAGDTVAVSNFENLVASALSGNLSIVGAAGANMLIAGQGADTIDGGGGTDSVDGGLGDDRVLYWGSEIGLDGGGGVNSLVMKAAATVDLSNTDVTRDDATLVANFQNIDASALTTGVSLKGSGSVNFLYGGAGADTIDGFGGLDTLAGNVGDDTLVYRGSEVSLDGGSNIDTLKIIVTGGVGAIDLSVASGQDQTSGDSVSVANFENVDAAALTSAIGILGSLAANAIQTGSGDDTIDGAGGLDVSGGGGGDDTLHYYGSEQSIDGGAGVNTLLMKTAQTIDLSAADQSVGDSVSVSNFHNIDAALLTGGVSLTGTSSANIVTSGSGADTIDGGGGADTIRAGDGNDLVTYRGSETLLDGGLGTDTLTLAVASGVTAFDFTVAVAADQSAGDVITVANFENLVATALTGAVTVITGGGANVISTGAGADTIQGGGGADTISAGGGGDIIDYHDEGGSIDGGAEIDTLVLKTSPVAINLANADQTTGDTVTVSNIENVDASALAIGVSLTGSVVANLLIASSGADTINGAGGGDTIDGGVGSDSIVYYASDSIVDGGANMDTLKLGATVAVLTIDLASVTDQTSGDTVTVRNFENIDASLMTATATIAGSSGANLIQTGSGADTIDGAGGADSIDGGAGADFIAYYGSESTIDGGANTDTLKLGATVAAISLDLASATDQTNSDTVTVRNFENVDASAMTAVATITGSSGVNLIQTGSGADTIDGVGGGDMIDGGAGADGIVYYASDSIVDGGANTDTLTLGAAVSAITIDLASAMDQTSGDAVTVRNFENVDASAMTAVATITGSSGANLIQTGSGADTIDGAGGGDSINAGGGNDLITYRGSETLLDGGLGSDTLTFSLTSGVTAFDFTVAAGADQSNGDTVTVANFENLMANSLTTAVVVTAGSAANAISTGSGNDTIDGGSGVDSINGGDGDDTISYYGVAGSTLDGGLGVNTLVLKTGVNINLNNADQTTTDSVTVTNFRNIDASIITTNLNVLGTGGVNNVINTGSGADTIDGFGGADVIKTNDGNDYVYFRGVEVSIDGGAGTDTLQFYASPGNVTKVDLSIANADQTVGDTTDVRNFENLTGFTWSMTAAGGSGVNTITAGAGNDTIQGGGGADLISGGAGNDLIDYYNQGGSIDGGADTDTLILKAAPTAVNLGNAADQTTEATNVVVINFENIDATTLATGVSLTGSATANSILGGSGADTIEGAGGADTIDGGSGADTIAYYGSEATIDGGANADTLKLSATIAALIINLASATDQTSGDTVTVRNFENVDASLMTANVTFTGTSGAETIQTGTGADTIDGAGSGDSINAGGGNDLVTYRGSEAFIDGGLGSDTLTFSLTSGVTAFDFTVAAGADQSGGDTVTVTNFENLVATSLTTAVAVTAGSAANAISTGSGADTIQGGGGADAINSGDGNDMVDYWGTETSIDGGLGVNTLIMKAATPTIDMRNPTSEETPADTVSVKNFVNIDASALNVGITIYGTSGYVGNIITGGSGSDTIDGFSGADVINTNGGNDRVYYRGSEALVDGGNGTDLLYFYASSAAVTTVNLGLVDADQTSGALDTGIVKNFESVTNFTWSMTVIGSSGANAITAGAGSDTIQGGGGADVISAGAGNDIVDYYNSGGSISGGTDTDTLVLKAAVTVNLANADQTTSDTVSVSAFENIDAIVISTGLSLTGDTNANSILGGSGADTIDGGGGNDTLDGGNGADSITGGAGVDRINYYTTASALDGGADADTLILKAAVTVNLANSDQTSSDTVNVTNFENIDATVIATDLSLTGNASANIITGGSGNDTIDGGAGADIIAGGSGNDSLAYYSTATSIDGGANADTFVLKAAVTVNLANADQTTDDTVTVSAFENIDATAISTALALTGDANANSILGGSGADSIDGSDGNDTIDGGLGADSITGGAGNDTISYYKDAGSALDGGADTNTLIMKVANTVDMRYPTSDETPGDSVMVTNFNNVDASQLTTGILIYGTSTGGASNVNVITGGSGNDTIDGIGGADVVKGNDGNDTIYLRGGEASLDGGDGTDTLNFYYGNSSGVTKIDLSRAIDQTDGDTADVRNFEGVQSISYSVTVVGSSGVNLISTGAGSDTLQGGSGVDTISGGAGNDRIDYYNSGGSLDGGLDTDTLVLREAVTVNLANADQTTETGLNVTVTGFESIDATAISTALMLNGSASANSITGGSENDTIDGKGGADSIEGGSGDDTIAYRGAETTIDGGAGENTLIMYGGNWFEATSVTDQTSYDSVTVKNFKNVTYAGSDWFVFNGTSGAETFVGGDNGSNDYMDGRGGADVLQGRNGFDNIFYYGSEVLLDGGAGSDKLTLVAAATVNLANSDQTSGDTVSVTGFETIDASRIGVGLSLTGSTDANTIIGGSGADTIDGAGGNDTLDGRSGADSITGGAGADRINYYTTASALDGGADTDTLVLKAAVTANLSNADETNGDAVNVTNFENIDATAIATGLSLTGDANANTITGGSGADTIDGGGGADSLNGGVGNDQVNYYTTASALDGGANTDTLILKAAAIVNLANADQTTDDSVTVSNFENINATGITSALSLSGSASANSIIGGSGNDTISGGGGGADTLSGAGGDDAFLIDVSSLKLPSLIDGGGGANTLTLSGTGSVSGADLLASLTNIQSIDFTAAGVDASLSLSGAQIAQIDGGAASILTLSINAGDSFALTDPVANYSLVTAGATSSYTIYNDALHSTVIAQLDVVSH